MPKLPFTQQSIDQPLVPPLDAVLHLPVSLFLSFYAMRLTPFLSSRIFSAASTEGPAQHLLRARASRAGGFICCAVAVVLFVFFVVVF